MPPIQSVDGISSEEERQGAPSSMKVVAMMILLTPYIIYVLWCVFLMSVLPNPEGKYQELISIGTLSAMIFGAMLLLLGFVLAKRILKAQDVSQQARLIGAAKVIAILVPGLALSGIVVITIPQEPKLSMEITEPAASSELIAPVAVTFSLEQAEKILQMRGLKAAKYAWDFDGDGVLNEETVGPTASAVYDKQGIYQVVARISLSDGSERRVVRSLPIPKAVFSTSPLKPIVDEPVRFSLEHLDSKENPIKEVKWDFNNDGEIDEVSSQVSLINTEPEYLVSPAPFGVIFTVQTAEPHYEILWDFDDGTDAAGDRVGHTFKQKGVYRVEAEVRSMSGSIARLSKTVNVVEVLRIPDLDFDGFPEVKGDKMSAEVPVTVNLTPRTSLPLIDFFWEAPKATVVESTDTTLIATYRRPGNYIITLIGNDPSGSVMRRPLSLEVLQPKSVVTMRMSPEGGVAPLLVRFDASETVIPGKEITGFEWTFGDEKKALPRQGGAQVEYLFDTPGTYNITLTAFTTSGEKFNQNRTIVIRAPVLDACFTTSRTSGKAPLGVRFDLSCSTGAATSRKWDFGDGSQSEEENPIHVFEKPGTYTIVLQLQDAAGSVSRETLLITAEP
ncbi:MAG: hypothetical protein UY90_C0070G0006 [Candidatus Peregrinibacteria bacterium GW2011_GWA2_54_9]|nr:MAG: hypothetical protein UY90_C0070G0006 [Candidatus Peregrinibacteria bacterium GW2011_GWA2_54_9]